MNILLLRNHVNPYQLFKRDKYSQKLNKYVLLPLRKKKKKSLMIFGECRLLYLISPVPAFHVFCSQTPE